jgi:hypothetical protein
MATEEQVRGTFTKTRDFYKGGAKSSNKGYVVPLSVGLTPEQKHRNDDMEWSAKLSTWRRDKIAGRTIIEKGGILYNSNIKAGNCGEMAAVAMFIAVAHKLVPPTEVVHVTAFNSSHTKWKDGRGSLYASKLKFGHSWLRIGPNGGEVWIVDPWANVCCRESEQKTDTRKSLTHWATENKRILVQWEDGAGEPYSVWTTATDDAVMALFDAGATHDYWYPTENAPEKALRRI